MGNGKKERKNIGEKRKRKSAAIENRKKEKLTWHTGKNEINYIIEKGTSVWALLRSPCQRRDMRRGKFFIIFMIY